MSKMFYNTYPTSYIHKLKQKGLKGRVKARCFIEFFDDREFDQIHAYRFYSKSWDVSVGTVFKWIKEFEDEIELFYAHWELKNKRNNDKKGTNAKKRNEHQVEKQKLLQASKNRYKKTVRKTSEIVEVKEVYNNNTTYYNNNKENSKSNRNKTFEKLYNLYSVNTQYVGNKEKCLKYYEENVGSMTYEQLKMAIVAYLNDKNVDKPVGMSKFFKNKTYIAYMPVEIQVQTRDGMLIRGFLDRDTDVFTDAAGRYVDKIGKSKVVRMFKEGRLKYAAGAE